MSASWLFSTPCSKMNYHLCCHRRCNHRLIFSPPFLFSSTGKQIVTTNSASVCAFTKLKERVTFEEEIPKSNFIAIAGHIPDEGSAQFYCEEEVRDPRATHNCWAYKVGEQYRTNDDGEPSGTAGKAIHSAIASSGLDRIMVVIIRHFGGIKLGTGGLVRAYGGVAAECLRNAPTCLIKSKVPMGLEVPFELLGVFHTQLQSFQAEDIKQDYDAGKDGVTMVTFKVNFDRAQGLEEAIKANCSRDIVFYKR
ncbi:uncharacterized protein LOC129900958 [Solanum dulcamara]|uniref:uncharacterized protein LOC129900958 n=1 Tax=Solanum dulcamara TaxID=45834 RepID=UPI0024852691|nr:uncharacterized protein LOC129900958 [Solanum dulcamara]